MGSDIDLKHLGGRLKLARNEVMISGRFWSSWGRGVAEHKFGNSMLERRKWVLVNVCRRDQLDPFLVLK